MSPSEIIATLEKASKSDRKLDAAIKIFIDHAGDQVYHGDCAGLTNAFTGSLDAALRLLPKSVTNFHLFSFSGHGRKEVKGDCWGAQCHDRDQFVGDARAQRKVKRMRVSYNIDVPPSLGWERAIAEQYLDFGTTHAASEAIAVCILAIKVRIGRCCDDDLWPEDIIVTGTDK